MTVGQRIKEARIKKGLSQTELAELLGYKSRSSINKIESDGRDIPRSSIVRFAEVLDVTPAYLMGWESEEPSNVDILPSEQICMVPVYESVSAGFGAYASSQVVEYMPLFIQNVHEAEEMLCIKVRGDSMYPKIEDGDTVVVHRQDSVDSGQIAVVMVDGEEGFVKKVVYDDDSVTLVSINPEYQDKLFKGRDLKRLRVVGLVKQIIKTV